MGARTDHWNDVYRTRGLDRLSWTDPGASESLGLVRSLVRPGDPVLDVGGGASALAAELLRAGLGPVNVLDVSAAALDVARAALGAEADRIDWIVADITRWTPDRSVALWHDRAVFHFLTDPGDRAAYVAAMAAAVRPGGHAAISTFADDGPEKCSGLPVVRYAPADLAATVEALAPGTFAPVTSSRHVHVTPGGAGQRFQTSVFRRR